MLVRVVKMQFVESKIDSFIRIFEEKQSLILGFPGCSFLQLNQSHDDPTLIFTISHWDSESALETYRNSALFTSTWRKTKELFSVKAEAWTVYPLFTSG